MMKDEGPYLIEWVAHHIAVGFTDFVIYTNDCTDGTDAMLQRLQALGFVQHRENRVPDGMKPQPSALKSAQVEPDVAKADWLLTFDADEFLCLRHGDGRLDGLIDDIKDRGANGMVITWRIFGSGGIVDWSRDPVTEQYLMAAPPMWNKGWGVKTLFQFDPEKWKLGIHRPKFRNKMLDTDFPNQVAWLNGSGQPMEDYFKFRGWRSIVRTVGYDWAQMNHYAVKSIDAYAVRRLRGNVNNKADKYNSEYWALQDRNEVRDDTMLRYKAHRDRIIAALLSDAELLRLHSAAVERAEAALAAFKAGPDYAAFVSELTNAGNVPITQVSAKPPKARDPAKIAASMSALEQRTHAARRDTLAKPSVERPAMPVALYVDGPVDLSADPPLEWCANHSVHLPADPRIFTPPALLQIQQGKFQRNLARLLPRLVPRNGRFLEIGAACGFLSIQTALMRADVTVMLAEDNEAFAQVLASVAGRNEAEARIDMAAGNVGAIAGYAADVLVIGSSEYPVSAVIAECDGWQHVPQAILIVGRALLASHDDTAGLSRAAAQVGLSERLALDPTLALGFTRPG
ncbi:MAG: glycosyltransferase family 2 protein [Pseudomonadota bacterium]